MSDLGLPTAAFGKDADRGDEFVVLWSRADFPDEARRALVAISKAFGLQGNGGESRYSPCFAIWPVSVPTGWVAARLRDAGGDAIGRSHTLHIDAVFVESEALGSAAGLLWPDAWPDGDWTETCSITLPDRDPQVADAIALRWKGQGRPKVLKASHNWYTSGFDVELDSTGRVVRPRESNVREKGGSEATAGKSHRRDGSTGAVSPRRGPTLTQVISLIGMLVLGVLFGLGWHTLQIRAMQRRYDVRFADVISDRDAAQARAEQSGQLQSQLERRVKSLEQEVAYARNARRSDESFVLVAKDFNIHNVFELRQALEQLLGRMPPDRSPELRLSRMIDEMESVIQDWKRTWKATQNSGQPSGSSAGP